MTIFETLRLHRELADAAAEWKRTRVELALATTSRVYDGQGCAAAAREHEAAITALLVAYDALADAQLPAVTVGNARRIGQLEGEIALAAIGWFHAREDASRSLDWISSADAGAHDESQALHEKVREFVDELYKLGAATA